MQVRDKRKKREKHTSHRKKECLSQFDYISVYLFFRLVTNIEAKNRRERERERKKASTQINAETSACPNYQTVVDLSVFFLHPIEFSIDDLFSLS
jgi:hypothetical protein